MALVRAGVALLSVMLLLVGYAVVERRALAPRFVAALSGPFEPLPKPRLDAGVSWSGDWYTLEWLDEKTVAIGEPRSPGRNTSYLLLGSDRALLFDVGEGHFDMKPVVDDLTALPVTVLPSHLHYDHIGSVARFERVALPDLPALRAQVRDGVLVPTYEQHLGVMLDVEPPELRPAEWWAPGAQIELGGRALEVRHTPGHTPESVSIWDAQREWLFVGDYLSPTPLYAFLPGSSLRDYRATARQLLAALPASATLWGAHDEPTDTYAPGLAVSDLVDVARVLEAIRRGEAEVSGVFPRIYPVNDRIEIWADFASDIGSPDQEDPD